MEYKGASQVPAYFNSEEAMWAWLFRTAQGKVQHHYRAQTSKRMQSKPFVSEAAWGAAEPVTGLFRKEAVDAIFRAMGALRREYRSVIVLRCMNEMSYRQIAEILGGTQLRNKMLFFRAKQALKQELARKGLGRSHFFGALAAFASVTALHSHKTSGAAVINVGLLKVGMPGVVLSAATTKLGMTAAAILLTIGLVTGFTATRPRPVKPGRYAHLMSLLQDPNFAYPTAVLRVHDPDGHGFTGIDASEGHPASLPITCRQVLVGEPNDRDVRLLLPARYWVEVGFAGPIIDGPGLDLFYTNWTCPICRVFLTDGADRIYELPRPTCSGNCDCFHITPFDLSHAAIPFTPQAIRIMGIGNWDFQLGSIRARIRPPRGDVAE